MSIVKTVQFNDGEAVASADFNNVSRFLQSQIMDLWATLARVSEGDIEAVAGHCYCMGNAGAPYNHADARKISNRRGWIAQQLGGTAISGDDPEFLYYYLTDDELVSTLAVGDATNPRYDILSVKLDQLAGESETRHFEDATSRAKSSTTPNKTRRVRCQFQVTQGTPAATPTEPATPAGYVKLCAVLVPATWNTTIDPFNIYDYRMPVGLTVVEVYLGEQVNVHIPNTGSFIVTGGAYTYAIPVTLTGGEAIIIEPCRVTKPNQMRLISLSLSSGNGADPAEAEVSLITVSDIGTSDEGVETDLETGLETGLLGSDARFRTKAFTSLPPVWANGRRSGYAARDQDFPGGDLSRLMFKLRCTVLNGAEYGMLRWVFAGM